LGALTNREDVLERLDIGRGSAVGAWTQCDPIVDLFAVVQNEVYNAGIKEYSARQVFKPHAVN
jgi:hypothetical protein